MLYMRISAISSLIFVFLFYKTLALPDIGSDTYTHQARNSH